MAALSADASPLPRSDPRVPALSFFYKATGADEYFRGAVVCETAGKALLTNLNAAETLGFSLGRVTVAAADEPVEVAIGGVWWVEATLLADAALITTVHPLAASDNPADLVVTAATNPGALGLLIHVDVTTTSGWIDLGQRSIPTNAA